MKLISTILQIESCFDCPFHKGGESFGSALYCEYFNPPKQIFNSNGKDSKFFLDKDIATFCELPDYEIFDMTLVRPDFDYIR